MKFGYTIIYVEDVRQTIEFYTQAFGFEAGFIYDNDGSTDYGEMQTGDVTLAFAAHSMGEANFNGQYQKVSSQGLPFGYELAFVDEQVQAAYDRAITAGATAISPPTEKPWGQTVAYVRAKEGTLIEICSPIQG
ncbi:VOC family protein [filamentous cyanobacterium LEGE 11480]|uniref:VOC family protein n=1 Tax=Romeriopsis navalis LEGE 11480 TaxID=2777977 RepID=A0A928VQN4_9CYAN|nr:VOC family protein [Romeriopsis navalis]MBE9032901.1 VOC family protein [Romeriopsis navalis LEGE 11480]